MTKSSLKKTLNQQPQHKQPTNKPRLRPHKQQLNNKPFINHLKQHKTP